MSKASRPSDGSDENIVLFPPTSTPRRNSRDQIRMVVNFETHPQSLLLKSLPAAIPANKNNITVNILFELCTIFYANFQIDITPHFI